MRSALASMLVIAIAAGACFDPVHADRVEALGPEAPGVDEGPDHRPGQPCTVCHEASGPGEPEFIVAGTVYETRDGPEPAADVEIIVTAANGRTATLRSNRVGNFYVNKREWDAPFPMHVVIRRGGAKKEMITRIGGDGGCGTCHRGSGDTTHAPKIYLKGDP